ncbi:BrxA/BrxB family bacilliredoxin [Salisaeta longa]|uniref:BrxA/BrxB family bacilliredoxin n=1 Tax=Salisaeta longa TaxID=503170 RepID=UPI00389B0757
MRAELTQLGVDELKTPADVDAAFDAADGTMLLVVNSVCGCAAGNARPAVAMAREADVQPDRYVTVFAGQDLEATKHVRDTYLPGIPPSSPFMALFRNGEPVYIIERKHIEGRSANAIAADLKHAFEAYCTDEEPPSDAPTHPADPRTASNDNVPSTFRSIM